MCNLHTNILNGMARRRSLLFLAVATGFATSVRPVGVAAVCAFGWYIAVRTEGAFSSRMIRAFVLLPIACWGLLCYVAYQWVAFERPFAFAEVQKYWTFAMPSNSTPCSKVYALLIGEPIWGVYYPGSVRYWKSVQGGGLLGVYPWNPVFFLTAIVGLVVGGWKRWLSSEEWICGAAMLAIPYLTRSYEMSMCSHGRFAAVVVMVYLVMGRVVSNYGRCVAVGGQCNPVLDFVT